MFDNSNLQVSVTLETVEIGKWYWAFFVDVIPTTDYVYIPRPSHQMPVSVGMMYSANWHRTIIQSDPLQLRGFIGLEELKGNTH